MPHPPCANVSSGSAVLAPESVSEGRSVSAFHKAFVPSGLPGASIVYVRQSTGQTGPYLARYLRVQRVRTVPSTTRGRSSTALNVAARSRDASDAATHPLPQQSASLASPQNLLVLCSLASLLRPVFLRQWLHAKRPSQPVASLRDIAERTLPRQRFRGSPVSLSRLGTQHAFSLGMFFELDDGAAPGPCPARRTAADVCDARAGLLALKLSVGLVPRKTAVPYRPLLFSTEHEPRWAKQTSTPLGTRCPSLQTWLSFPIDSVFSNLIQTRRLQHLSHGS